MTTSRRSFLRSALAAICAAPLLARSAFSRQPEVLQKVHEVPVPTPLPPPRTYVVQGLAIKVPSNRWHRCVDDIAIEGQPLRTCVEYVGDWDGTFKLESGCSNPAYILADLIERTSSGQRDWVTNKRGRETTYVSRYLNWQMLYDWGCYCDEPIMTTYLDDKPVGQSPRFCVNTVCQTREDMIRLRETLRMHCLSWQSTDPRYRTSWPGISYPETF